MPRLYHQKSTRGCERCKRRKVKCDEAQPACGACSKHNLPCHYPSPAASSDVSVETSYPPSSSSSVKGQRNILPANTNTLSMQSEPSRRSSNATPEDITLRLFHYFLTRTANMFLDDSNFWKTRTPLIAFDHLFVYDALISLAAIDLYRQTHEIYAAEEANKAAPSAQKSPTSLDWMVSIADDRLYLAGKTPKEIRRISTYHFHLAIEGQRRVLQNLQPESFESAFVASVVISTAVLFLLGCPEDEDEEISITPLNESLWFRLADGSRELWAAWQSQAGQSGNENVLEEAGYFKMEFNLADKEQIFHPSHREVFGILLGWASEFENITADEQRVYEHALSFIGVLFKVVRDEYPVLVSSAMIVAMPAYMEPPFQRLVLEARPRALVIMAHVFAIMRILETKVLWYKGIAARQIPSIYERVPRGWQKVMQWPLAVLNRDPESQTPIPKPPTLDDLD